MKNNENATVNNEETTKEVKNVKEEKKEAAQKTEQAPEAPKEEQKDLPAEVKPEEEKEGFFAKCKRITKEKVVPTAKKFGKGLLLVAGGYVLCKGVQAVNDRKLAAIAEAENKEKYDSYEPETNLENCEIQDSENSES